MRSRLSRLSAVAVAVCVLVPGLAQARSEAGTVQVTLKEFGIALSAKSAPKGAVTFVVTNKGKLPHDFVIAGKRSSKLAPGKTIRLTVNFAKAGSYAYTCSVSGHGGAGMKGAFSVR
jgi:uncharacterized cupredoxin-like copper-binding protein